MSRFQISRDSIEIRDLNARNVIRTRSWKRKRKAEPQEWHRSMQRELPGRVSRRFPDNRSHLCQVVEPQGFPPRLGDEVTIRYFLLLGRQRGSAVEARAHCQKREERKKRKKKKRKRRRSRRLERINRANRRERERKTLERWKVEGRRWTNERGRRRTKKEKEVEKRKEAGGGREYNCTVYPWGLAELFSGFTNPVDRAEFEGRCSSFVRTATSAIPQMT